MLDINFNESWNELDRLNSSKKEIRYNDIKDYFDRNKSGYPEFDVDPKDVIFLTTARDVERSLPNRNGKSYSRGLSRIVSFYNAHVAEKAVYEYLNKYVNIEDSRGIQVLARCLATEQCASGYFPISEKDWDRAELVGISWDAANEEVLSAGAKGVDLTLKIRYYNAESYRSRTYYIDVKNIYWVGQEEDQKKNLQSVAAGAFFVHVDSGLVSLYCKNSGETTDLFKLSPLPEFIDAKDVSTSWDEFNIILSEGLLEGIDPTTKFDKPWELDKIPDQDFIDAGLDKKDYIDQAWAAWRNKKMGNVEYVSKAASNETARKKAEDDYNYALKKLGAIRRYPNKYGRGSYDAPEGVFDLDNFHVAFDKWFEDHGLMKLFDKEGKLKMKGSWGDISKLDKNEAPAKALIDLWRAQYSGGKTFKSAWDAEQQKKQAEEQAAKVRKDWEDQEDKDAKDLEEEIKKAILNSVDWINLKKVYASHNKEDADKIDVDVEVWTRGYKEDQTKIQDSRVVNIWFKNMIGPDTDQFEALCAPKVDPLKISDSVDVIVKQLNSALTDLADAYDYLAELGSSWIAFTRSKTYEALGDNWRSIMFFNPADKQFYKITKKRVVSMSKDRHNSWSYSNIKSSYDDIPYLLLTYDIDGKTRNYDVDYDISWEPVYACIKASSDGNGNYKHWESSEAYYVFNLKYGTDILDKAGMRFYKHVSDPIETCEVENASAPYNIAFEKSSKYSYFLDSSD